jgi:hypothetical protein
MSAPFAGQFLFTFFLFCSDYSGWVSDALCLVASSRGGLRESELLQILTTLGYTDALEVSVLHWKRLRHQMGDVLWDSADGRVRFAHEHIKELTLYILIRKCCFILWVFFLCFVFFSLIFHLKTFFVFQNIFCPTGIHMHRWNNSVIVFFFLRQNSVVMLC